MIKFSDLQKGMQMDRTTLLANPEIAKALIGKNYATLLGPDREGDYQRYKDVGFSRYSGQVGQSYGSTLDAYIRSLSDPSPRYNKAELPGLIQGELNQAINQYKGAGVDPSTVPWLTNKYAEAGITTPWADTGQATGYVQPERNYNLAGTPQTQTLASIMNPTTPTKYYQFKGSPDVFDQSGNYVSSTQASAIPNFFQNVQQLDYVRPEVKSTTDFSTYSGKPVSVSAFTNPPPTPQGGTGTGGGTGDYSSVIQGAMTAIPTVSAEQGKVDQTYQSIIDKMKELEGQTAYQQSQEDLQGVTATKAAIRDLTAQLTALNASTAATQTNIEGRPMSMDAIVGQQGEVGRQNAIKALGLSSQIQALNGNLQTAIDSVNKMVDLKYNPIKTQLDELNVLLAQNRDALSAAEKRQADALTLQNNIKLKQLDIKIADEKAWETNANQALANGAPISVITNARTLYAKGDEDGARALLSKYTGTPSNELGAGTVGEKRDYAVSTYLDSKKGTDGFVAAETYQQALKTFIAKGGTQSNFFASYPQQTYLRQQEINKLPAAMKPQQVTTKSDLSAEQQSIINDAKAAIDQVKQRYGDWGATRQSIIDQAKQQFNFDISPYI